MQSLSAVKLYERACHHRRRGWRASADILLQVAIRRDPDLLIARHALKRLRTRPAEPTVQLRAVILGTTGTCNASCIHCPTGKAETAHVPRGTMPMSIYKKLIDGICELALEISLHVSFGLFGDGLVDPLVVERSGYLRRRLPHVPLCINTNGAAFNRNKHAMLVESVSTICLHCESLDAETYNDLMQPLRFARVAGKYEEILKVFPGKTRVSVPVSRRNMNELRNIQGWFLDHGAREVSFDPISRRCADDPAVFDALALQPQKIACRTNILDDLIIDCDGLVLACCNDFSRREPIGDLATCDIGEILRDEKRASMRSKLANGLHDQLKTCSKCYSDINSENFPFDVKGFSASIPNLVT